MGSKTSGGNRFSALKTGSRRSHEQFRTMVCYNFLKRCRRAQRLYAKQLRNKAKNTILEARAMQQARTTRNALAKYESEGKKASSTEQNPTYCASNARSSSAIVHNCPQGAVPRLCT